MGDLVVFILKTTLKVPFILIVIGSFIAILNLALGMSLVLINNSALGDLFALVQMWLPFNLSTITVWFTTITIAYLTYRLSLVGLSFLHQFFGR